MTLLQIRQDSQCLDSTSAAGAGSGAVTKNIRKGSITTHSREEGNSIIRLNLISLLCYLCKEKEGYYSVSD